MQLPQTKKKEKKPARFERTPGALIPPSRVGRYRRMPCYRQWPLDGRRGAMVTVTRYTTKRRRISVSLSLSL
jgi:hypothetical protein